MPNPVGRLVRSNIVSMSALARLRRLASPRSQRGLVAMFHIGRCGSTVVASLLEQHSQIRWGGELFEDIRSTHPGYEPTVPWIKSVIEARQYQGQRDYFGFETKAIHFTNECLGMPIAAYVELLRRLGYSHFIVLTRRNLLRVVTSTLVGHQQRAWHALASPAGPSRIRIDLEDPWGNRSGSLLDTFGHYERYYATLGECLRDQHRLDLNYEIDIEADPSLAYARTCRFLDVAEEPTAVRLARTNPYGLESIVTNFDEVAGLLRGTKHEWMLAA